MLWASGIVVIGCTLMAVLGALRTGITWDEPYHVMRLRNYLDDGWFALDWSLDGPLDGAANTAVYGPVTMLLLHTLGVATGAEGWAEVSTQPHAYDVRHLGVVLIGLVGTAAAAAISRRLLGSWTWGLVTAAVLLALPMWTGHLMFNIKDVPVATGYTLVTLGLTSMLVPTRPGAFWRVLALASGTVLVVGTRPGMWVAVALSVAVAGLGVLAGPGSRFRRAVAESLTGLGLAAGVLLMLYPNLFAHPQRLVGSAEQSASFRDRRDAVVGYVPFFVAAQTPLILLGFSLFGLGVAAVALGRHQRTDRARVTVLALVLAQLLALPLISTLMVSDLYNALRQLLFTTPAWAVIATYGMAYACARVTRRRRTGLVAATIVVGLALPTAAQAAQFPYQYTSYNAGLDLTGIHVPSDYWRASVPELLDAIPTDGPVVCSPTRSGPDGIAGADGVDRAAPLSANRFTLDSSVDCRVDPIGPLAPLWAAAGRGTEDALAHDEFYAVIDRDHELPDNCSLVAEVTRQRNLRTVRMTYLARCRLAPPTLSDRPVRFVRDPAEPVMDPALWAFAPLGWVQRNSWTAIDAPGTSAALSFDVTGTCPDNGCRLILDADAPADLIVTVDDVPTGATAGPDGLEIQLPTGATATWVGFTRTSGAPLDLRVRGMRLDAPPQATEESP